MGQPGIEKFEVKVPNGEGHLIGDLLRKYATRGVSSWQIVGYKAPFSAVNFGFSSSATVSYLELLKGTLVCVNEPRTRDPGLYTLQWNGECFAGDGFELHGITHGVGDSVSAFIVYGKGYKTAEQNYEVIKGITGNSMDGVFAVPSSHSVVQVFRYSVEPYDTQSEWLRVEADKDVARAAYYSAFNTLQGIEI